ncbi:guanine nucleotide exchange factor [Talaromyces proteolyticus]|uniref:Guanine nucleotide exchange factor n=1 Tax=Talaromyces proteolyticus TaxID=1131652 RepID=A0AAD4KUJ4_9EURO|nr:guanine nucleotide exchange factor [Talaromyces proteolyticus]KAH8700246.1 guanine nucleotide exchange factor [Talaromyces proteolyticus]
MSPGQLQGPEKLKEVTRLVDSLDNDLSAKKLSPADKVQTLLALRQHGTNPANADPIYSDKGINLLARYGFEGETLDIRRAALRCIANALLLNKDMRQVFVDTGYAGRVAEKLKTEISDDEMILSRILFLTTYDTNIDFSVLITKHSMADNILSQVIRHAKQIPKNGRKSYSQIDELALTDTLKLVFNVAKLYPDLADSFTPLIPHLFKIINRIDIPDRQPLDGLIGYIINALSTLDLEEKPGRFESNPLFPKFNQNCNVDKLINILDAAVGVYNSEELEPRAVPLLHLLITIYEFAPEGPRKYMQWLLLPEDNDRSVPIGRSDTLSSKLLNLSTSPSVHLKTAISELMFVLSGKDADSLTKNIGYGFAAGFLASRGLQIPQDAQEAFATNSSRVSDHVNPITGQRYDAEPVDTGPPMTQEEKEREAERLFVLFERLTANGLIKAENPVAQAVREGRLEELPDDADSDLD